MDLNLKLMRWRALPELQVDKVSQSRCLLLGAGTLGCAVARILQGWGCRKITFVDSGKVAFSNPVRQSLFEFSDCLEGGRPKAVAAAEALKRIFPHADSTGVQLTIPMPGHPVKEGSEMHKQSMEAVQALDKLVSDHDIVFLLTDTRESRWLPTVLSLAHNKFAVSVALGFDTFLVMRHGSASSPEGKRLGCYFCNDVAAPLNSTKNRTMDQQCTVVRPGLASIASALAVELVSAVLQHPMKSRAPAPTQNHGGNGNQKEEGEGEGDENGGRSILGDLPHSIRGFLDNFSQLCILCPAFPNCVACSDSVLQAYMDESRRQGFLLQVFNDPFFLEELTGLQELKNAIDDIDLDFDEEGENSDSDDFQLL
jgi:ubiquitin-like modifier-activating enzyme ATG7